MLSGYLGRRRRAPLVLGQEVDCGDRDRATGAVWMRVIGRVMVVVVRKVGDRMSVLCRDRDRRGCWVMWEGVVSEVMVEGLS